MHAEELHSQHSGRKRKQRVPQGDLDTELQRQFQHFNSIDQLVKGQEELYDSLA